MVRIGLKQGTLHRGRIVFPLAPSTWYFISHISTGLLVRVDNVDHEIEKQSQVHRLSHHPLAAIMHYGGYPLELTV